MKISCENCLHNGVCFRQEVTNDINKWIEENGGCEHYKAKREKMEWVGFPCDGVWSTRCGNIECARKIPFGCNPNEFNYCPFCGSEVIK